MHNARKRKVQSALLRTCMIGSAGLICCLLIGLIGYILYRGLPGISLSFLTSEPSLIRGTNGILPNLLNTLYLVGITLILVIPIGTGAAIYLNEYAKNRRLVRLIELAAETLSGIPSVIFGLVGMLVFVQFFQLGTSVLAGGLTLAVMTLPTVLRTVQESLKAVPGSYREGALALGSGQWHMIRTVVLPSAADGIVTGCILAVGRITGESAALLFTAGMANECLNLWEALTPGHAGSPLTVALYMYAKERGEFDTAFAIAAILLLLSLCLNPMTKLAAKILKKKGC